MIKVLTIVGTRPEIIKLSCIIKELDKFTDHVLVHTGQNYDYELNEVFFKDLEIRKPDYFLNAAGENAAETIANVIKSSDEILDKVNPDAFLIYGDTNSCLSVISAKRRKIPIFHIEAGNRCFDQRVPEEINRKIVDHLSDINMTLSEHARRYLIAEGLKPETIFKIGSPMKEVLNNHFKSISGCEILKTQNLEKGRYFIVSAHREENVDNEQNLLAIINTLDEISLEYNYPVLVSTHPRTQKRLNGLRLKNSSQKIQFLKPFGFFEYVNLMINSCCVISDSGTITEESSILGFPAVMIRESHERPEGMDEGTVIMAGLRSQNVLDAVRITIQMNRDRERPFRIVNDYDIENVSKKVVKIIQSYYEYVNRNIWHK